MNAQTQPAVREARSVTQYPNPMGINGFEFVEFASTDGVALHQLFRQMGFSAVAKHRTKNITLYRQGGCNFLINEEPASFAADFAKAHGPCACGFAIRVENSASAYSRALNNGGEAITNKPDSKAVNAPVIKGIGDCMLYLVDCYGEKGNAYELDFLPLPGVAQNPRGYGLTFIDHLTHNLHFGNMEKWSDYYERIFNFREIRYFDIKGAKTGLVSKAMTAPDNKVRIPLNESPDPKSQINEYLDLYKGEGIQHIALFTTNIYETVESMRSAGVQFLDTPDTYYAMIDQRILGHNEDVARMRKNKILIDADLETKKKLLLQIFTQTNIGPIFFEIIQRKGNEGFGEGNFQALFDAIERDQEVRGVL